MHTINAYLLSSTKYGDNDAVLCCFSLQDGYKSYFLKGLYSSRNKKKALLNPLNELQIYFNKKQYHTLTRISKIELITPSCSGGIKEISIVFFVTEILHQILKKEDRRDDVYYTINLFIQYLNKGYFQVHLIFLLRMLHLQGISPLIGNGKYLNPRSGTSSSIQELYSFNEEISSLWREIILSENNYETKIPTTLRKQFLESIFIYYRYHFPDFKIPSSLEILEEIFE